jgi:hypothetical protein
MDAVIGLAFAAFSHPQTAFVGLQKLLQHKWQFVQRVIDGIGDSFFPLLAKAFLAAIKNGDDLKQVLKQALEPCASPNPGVALMISPLQAPV